MSVSPSGGEWKQSERAARSETVSESPGLWPSADVAPCLRASPRVCVGEICPELPLTPRSSSQRLAALEAMDARLDTTQCRPAPSGTSVLLSPPPCRISRCAQTLQSPAWLLETRWRQLWEPPAVSVPSGPWSALAPGGGPAPTGCGRRRYCPGREQGSHRQALVTGPVT